jgi:hypothetical protein
VNVWFIAAALAGPGVPTADDVHGALVAELARVPDLALPDHGPPHHVLTTAAAGWEVHVEASFGALVDSDTRLRDDMRVEVRAGTPEFDSTGIGTSWDQPGIESTGLPDLATERGVREDVWRWVDYLYKEAVENLGRKEASRGELEDADAPVADWAPTEPLVRRESVAVFPARPDAAELEALARAATGAVRGRRLERADADVWWQDGHRILVDTDGLSVVQADPWARVRVTLSTRSDDGEARDVVLRWSGRSAADLPPVAELQGAVLAAADGLDAWRDAPRLEEPWYGPVVLEGSAAAQLLYRRVITPLEGTPDVARQNPWSANVTPAKDRTAAPGTRVLPRGWSVVDDATRDLGAPCCPAVDGEGVPPRQVELVSDGAVQAHLMTRTLSGHFSGSTGHAAPARDRRCSARATWVTVDAPGPVSHAKLRKIALREAAHSGADRILVLGDTPGLGHWLTADGQWLPVRGFDAHELDLRPLRGMTVAGPSSTVDLPRTRTVVTVPDLLVPNVAVLPESKTERGAPRRRQSPLVEE